MFSVEVRDRFMVAHSLPSPVFGLAQGMHGATFVVDAAFYAKNLDENGLVVDIGRALETLSTILKPMNYANLDEVEAFTGKITTTEFLCHHIWLQLRHATKSAGLGDNGRICRIKVSLHESDVARGFYEADV